MTCNKKGAPEVGFTAGARERTSVRFRSQDYNNIIFLRLQEQTFKKGGKFFMDEIILRSGKKNREPMSFEKFKFVCYFIAGMVAMVMGFIALYMIIYFAGR